MTLTAGILAGLAACGHDEAAVELSSAEAPEADAVTSGEPTTTQSSSSEPLVAKPGEALPTGNYRLSLDEKYDARCVVSGMLACEVFPVSTDFELPLTAWRDDAVDVNPNGLAVKFGPARTKTVLGNLGDITIHGELPAGAVYTVGEIRIDLTHSGTAQFFKDGESAWFTRMAYGPTGVDYDAPPETVTD
ncbi:MAG: hypothetical protein ACTH0G_12660 [Corynebacterium variabile]